MFAKWLEDHCADPVDIDVGLIEVRDDPDAHWTMRALAGHSVGMPAEEGYQAVLELQTAIGFCVDGRPEGKAMLADILSSTGIDYQRALYFALAGRGPSAMLIDLKQLVAMMEARLRAGETATAKGMALKVRTSPYAHCDSADGPPGSFCPDFKLAPAWDGIVQPD